MPPTRPHKASKEKTKTQGGKQGKTTRSIKSHNVLSKGETRKGNLLQINVPCEDYQSLVDNSLNALAVLDRAGTVLYSNQRGMEIWQDPNIVGKTIFDLFPPEYVKRYQVAIQHVIDSQTV